MSEHITEPPAYDKPANQYVEQKPSQIVRDLLNAAENRAHHVTVVGAFHQDPAAIALHVADGAVAAAIRAGTVKVSGFGIKDCNRLVVELPEVPAGTQVEAAVFHVSRGDAKVRIGQDRNGAWHVDATKHEAEDSDYFHGGFAPTNPTLNKWREMVYARVFTEPKGAIELAVAWLDALDSWHTSAEAGRMSMENRLSGLLV